MTNGLAAMLEEVKTKFRKAPESERVDPNIGIGVVKKMSELTTPELKRLGYVLPLEGSKIRSHVSNEFLSQQEFDKYRFLVQSIAEVNSVVIPYCVLKGNYNSVTEEIVEAEISLADHIKQSLFSVHKAFEINTELIRLITNYLSSTNAFLCLTERKLQRWHGATSCQFQNWDAQKNGFTPSIFRTV